MPVLNDDLLVFADAIVRGDELSPDVVPSYPNYPATVALEVYRNNHRGNLHDALAGAYPVMAQLVGKDFFRLMTKQFIERHPSRSGNLHRYGTQMAAFVASFAPAQQLVYLPDVAALEWACHCAYFAEDAGMLDIDRLSQLAHERYPDLVLHTHPACHVVRSRYPIAAIWHAHQTGAPGDFHIDLDDGPCIALVIRNDAAVQVSELNVADGEWLSNIQAGTTLGVATSTTLERYPDFDLQTALNRLVSLGVFSDFDVRS